MARPKSQNERRRKFDQDPKKQMMNQISARIDMLHPHQVEIKPKTQNRPQHRQQDQQQRLMGSRPGHWIRQGRFES
jgi:hypothetical protein